ncbi:MAG TPA: hypothetical protein VMF30_14540 [Pirellulales bacterium]|nr:hypothetical protein [Pirellulales bacterium]
MSQNLHDASQPEGPRPQLASPTPQDGAPPRPETRSGAPYSSLPTPPGIPPAPAASGAKIPWRKTGLAVLAAAGVVAGVAIFALSGGSGDNPPPSTPVPAAESHVKKLFVTAVDADQRATDKLKQVLTGTKGVSADDLNAVNAAGLAGLAQSAPKLAADVQSGRRVLYRLYLLDFLVEDGDQVELSVDGVSFGNTVLKGAGTSYLIPLAHGTPANLKIVATADGGGGVTVGFVSSAGEARTEIMQVGDYDQWQAMVQ